MCLGVSSQILLGVTYPIEVNVVYKNPQLMNDYEYVIEVSKIRKYRIQVVSLCPSKLGCMSAGGTESAEVVVSEK